MKQKLHWMRWALLLIALLVLPALPIEAQSPLPKLKTLLIELWPEYDRPEVLVIYRAELSPDTVLPAPLTFHLPGYIETMNAIAVEQNGSLFTVDEEMIELRHEDDDLVLTFPATEHKVQLEYYDPVILTRQNQARQLDFDFSAPYEIEVATFEVQEPFQAEDFLLSPDPDRTFTGNDGLRYHTIDIAGLTHGETFELTATYKRNTDQLSAQRLANLNPETAVDTAVAPTETTTNQQGTIGYVLVGAGVVLLLGTGGYWWWSNRAKSSAATRRRPSTRPVPRKKRTVVSPGKPTKKQKSAVSKSPPSFCYRCGTALRSNSNFCHNCGTERRRE